MKFIGFLVAILLAVAGVAAAEEPGAARLSLVKGDVQIYTDDAGEWVPAAVNMPLHEGDRLWSPEGGQAEVQIRGGVYLRLDAATSLDILNLGEDSFHFYQAEGRSYINNRRGGIDHIQIDTPLSSVGCYDNSLIMVDVTEGEVTSVSVLKGYASAETRSGKTRVSAGQSLRIGADQEADLFPLSSPDRWERWNRDRDRRVAAAESLRYIPDELDDYASDLDQNGRWLYAPEYGYVWSPQLSVSVGWAPYQSGRWVWIRGDYVWISYEPWGWAPYHYGRWAYVARFGWCWVPPARGAAWWAPGYVGWVSTPGYVAWVPLAPGEVYYGYGHYGPTSVNITNVTINRTVVREYRNVSVTNAVTVVNRDGFLHGRRERVTVRGNPFTAANVAIGPPRFRPAREALRPVDRKIPPRMAPPEKVQRVRVEDIRRERRLVPEERGSVFRPAVPAQELRVRKREAPTRVIEEKAPPAPREKAVPARRGPQGRSREDRRSVPRQSGAAREQAPRQEQAEKPARQEIRESPPPRERGSEPRGRGRREERE
ncbi:DUF6600 domain-containing protein [Geobacter pickeringii]|uniref:FecR protein domain-containing protein n=1 Tax=Geobacter pickeringii TaxID=345632 RepID=A0A0B5BC98_9BACT|nr:DUF6600 domain-containing protein [Geobacter pickeringii]AJE04142.1 hypothetical protein GPICK_12945 [Geobacter pickeringii]